MQVRLRGYTRREGETLRERKAEALELGILPCPADEKLVAVVLQQASSMREGKSLNVAELLNLQLRMVLMSWRPSSRNSLGKAAMAPMRYDTMVSYLVRVCVIWLSRNTPTTPKHTSRHVDRSSPEYIYLYISQWFQRTSCSRPWCTPYIRPISIRIIMILDPHLKNLLWTPPWACSLLEFFDVWGLPSDISGATVSCVMQNTAHVNGVLRHESVQELRIL